MNTLEEAVLSGELVTVPMAQQLFPGATTPSEILAEARMVAEALKPALITGGMLQQIGESEHVKIEGWQTLGSMLKVFPHVIWTRQLQAFDGWESRAEIRTLDGNVLSAGQAMCERGEDNWKHSPEYAIYSMSQTRAMSKAFAGPLRFIITLAGYSGVPAEEMGGGVTLNYGKPAKPREMENLERAALILYGGDVDAASALLTRLAKDSGGYMPKIVARAVQLVAAKRPMMTDANPVPDEALADDPPDAQVVPEEPLEEDEGDGGGVREPVPEPEPEPDDAIAVDQPEEERTTEAASAPK